MEQRVALGDTALAARDGGIGDSIRRSAARGDVAMRAPR